MFYYGLLIEKNKYFNDIASYIDLSIVDILEKMKMNKKEETNTVNWFEENIDFLKENNFQFFSFNDVYVFGFKSNDIELNNEVNKINIGKFMYIAENNKRISSVLRKLNSEMNSDYLFIK